MWELERHLGLYHEVLELLKRPRIDPRMAFQRPLFVSLLEIDQYWYSSLFIVEIISPLHTTFQLCKRLSQARIHLHPPDCHRCHYFSPVLIVFLRNRHFATATIALDIYHARTSPTVSCPWMIPPSRSEKTPSEISASSIIAPTRRKSSSSLKTCLSMSVSAYDEAKVIKFWFKGAEVSTMMRFATSVRSDAS